MTDITIRRAGREYVTWPVTGIGDADALDVSADGITWVAATRATGTASVLVAGPDATSNPAGTLTVAAGYSPLLIRRTDSPEVVIRAAGKVRCY